MRQIPVLFLATCFCFPCIEFLSFLIFIISLFFFISTRARVIIIFMCAQYRVSRQEAWRSEVFLSINIRNGVVSNVELRDPIELVL